MKKEGERLVGFILGVLSSIDRPTMVEWIKTDFMPPVFEFELPPYLIGVKSLMADYKDQILEGLTVANTVKYCNEYRPDLVVVIQHPKGKRWIENFLKVFLKVQPMPIKQLQSIQVNI